jgi:hypothetical protein
MKRDSNNGLPNADEILNNLIRWSREGEEIGFERPGDDAIIAYLLGAATPREEKAVREALISSAAFRREILRMAQDMDALAHPDTLESKKKAVPTVTPGLAEFLRAKGESGPGLQPAGSFWDKLRTRRLFQAYIPAIATTIILVSIIVWTASLSEWAGGRPQPAHPALETGGVEVDLLISKVTRDAAETMKERAYSTPREAALAELRLLVEHKEGRFHLRPPETRPQPVKPFRSVSLVLVDELRNEVGRFNVDIPSTGTIAPHGVQAWILTFPSRDLRTVDIPSDTTFLEWPSAMESRGCITLTYPYGDGYRAAVGFAFRLR